MVYGDNSPAGPILIAIDEEVIKDNPGISSLKSIDGLPGVVAGDHVVIM